MFLAFIPTGYASSREGAHHRSQTSGITFPEGEPLTVLRLGCFSARRLACPQVKWAPVTDVMSGGIGVTRESEDASPL